MRKGCLFITLAILVGIALVLISARSQTIERGLKRDPYKSGDFTFSAWSYGEWVESRQSGVHVSTYEPPYTVIVAISPEQDKAQRIEILSATVTDRDGKTRSILDILNHRFDRVEMMNHSSITSPYAAFTFETAFDSNSDAILTLSFRVISDSHAEDHTQSLELTGFENSSRSFTFLDEMSGI